MSTSYEEVIERMKRSGRLKNDSKVARCLKVTPQALSNYKKRGAMPSDLIIRFATLYGLSVDWLLTGTGDMRKDGQEPVEGYEADFSAAFSFANEDQYSYGKSLISSSDIDPDELIYIGKLLKLLREGEEPVQIAIKSSLDAMAKTVVKKETENKK